LTLFASRESGVRPLDRYTQVHDHDPVDTPRWLVRAGWVGWRGELGWALIGLGTLGSCVLCASLSYAGMPAQDATPEMLVKTAKDGHDAEVAMAIGAGVGLATVIVGIWLVVVNRRLSRRVG
jgi:hypothetical protein